MTTRVLALPWLVSLIASPLPLIAQESSPTVTTVTFDAPSVGRTMKYNIALPDGYDASDARYPVIYLLHGYSSNYTAWAGLGAPRAAKGLGLILVMPDAGNSWYVNWAEVEGGAKGAWEDCFVKDLIGHVDANFRTIARREGRAINGLSMGGYGALTLGLRHPDLFCAIGSQSGALGFARSIADRLKAGDDLGRSGNRQLADTPNPRIGLEDFDSQAERTPRGKMFATAEQAEVHDPFRLVKEVSKDKIPHICIDCGTEDRLIDGSRDFVKLLIEEKIPFTYAESPGGHVGAYWSREIAQAIAIQNTILRRNLAKAAAD